MEKHGYDLLIEKIDQFVRKYYKNMMLKGLIYGLAIISGFFLLVVTFEYFGRFSSAGRTVLFFLFLSVALYTVVKFIVVPASKLFRLGKIISHEEAALVIGTHFTNVNDKLLNTLQLKKMADFLPRERELILAGIDQRIQELKPVPFQAAIDFAANKKHLKYALPPAALLLVLLITAPSMLTETTKRLVNFREEIIELAPYDINLLNDELSVLENRDFDVIVKTTGREIPERMYIQLGGSQFLMRSEGKNTFAYTLKNVREKTDFRFYGAGFYSSDYTLSVVPAPKLISFEMFLDYPAYTGLTDQTIKNTGDTEVPEGTKILWKFNTKNTGQLAVFLADSAVSVNPISQNEWSLSHTALQTVRYALTTANEYVSGQDSVSYELRVRPDAHPLISVDQKADETSLMDLFFTGEVRDDYGFSRLSFHYVHTSGGKPTSGSKELTVSRNTTSDRFYYHWDMAGLGLAPGDELEYYFEIRDNDGINGPKASRSTPGLFKIPTAEELKKQEEEGNDDIKSSMEQSMKEAKALQKEMDAFRKDLLDKKEMNWQDQTRLEDLLKRQQNLENNIENLKNKNEQKNQLKNQFDQQDERILEKQRQLEELFDQLLSDEMKKLYDELQKLMEELNKDKLQEELDKMKFNTEELEKELDRALEQFKQLEWESKMEEAIDELNKLAEEQKKLAEETEKSKDGSEDLKKKQEELNDKFDQVKDDLKKLEQLNKELEFPNQMPETGEDQKDIQKDMKDSSDQLQEKKNNKASKSQNSAAQKMKQMAEKMDAAMAAGASEQQQEDMDALRQLLENIITLSFDQERLMSDIKKLDPKDPKYVNIGKQQRKLKDDTKMVEDSLLALAKRVMAIQPIVMHEVGLINDNIAKALDNLGERITPKVTEHQQYAMTSFNNLALLLDEALKQMQQQMSCTKPGTGNCQKPGGSGSKPSAGDMKKQQEGLSKQMQKMKEQLEKGNNKGDGKQGQQQLSKELAETAAKQAAIRKEIERMAQELNQDGSGAGNALKEIAKEMEEVERDLVNKNILEETLRRQQDILTRLLKAENAERERDQDEKRKSNEARDIPKALPPDFEEYRKKKEKENEFYRSLPPELKPYYKDKVNDYFNNLDR